MTERAAGGVFRFGVFEADAARGELRKHGIRVKLHAQPFQILVMLLERPSEVVTREDMRQRLWADGTFVDFDHALNTAVNKIREVLNDSASSPRYVETVAGKGYRFIAPVALNGRAPSPEPAPVTEPEANSVLSAVEELPRPPRKTVSLLLVLVQLLYLGFYLTALANLREVDDLFVETNLLPPAVLMGVLVGTAAILIPVRLYLIAAAAFDLRQLPAKFARIFPALLVFDEVWALSPFLLAHYISAGFALGMTAILVYLPFAQRSLVLMYERAR
jgi:DNA-binding winged helix-turn-helix (wHTH) protein